MRRLRTAETRGSTRRERINPLLFVFPAMLYLGLWVYYPIARNLQLSFLTAPTPRSKDYSFAGLQNYRQLVDDDVFLLAIGHNVIWVLLSIAIPVVIGLLLAVLLAGRRSRLVYATIFFIPVTVASIIAAIVWRWIYNPNVGALNQLLEAVGLGALKQFWLGDERLALVSVNMIGSWGYFGFCTLIFLAGLQNIDPDLNEAAKIDGAGPFRRFFYVTLPLLRNTILFMTVYTIIGSMKFFDLIYVTTNGGPNESSQVVGVYMYDLFLRQGEVNYAASMSTVLTVIILLLSLVVIRNLAGQQLEVR